METWPVACWTDIWIPGMPRRLAPRAKPYFGKGNIVVIGATASVKHGANFAAFTSAKAAQRALAQSIAKHVGREGVHGFCHLIWFGCSEYSQRQASYGGGCRGPNAEGTGPKLLEMSSAQEMTLMGECVECGRMDGEETLRRGG